MVVAAVFPGKTAGIYCRISDADGDDLGIRRQEALCRKLAAELGWAVGDVYVDNSVSAWSRKPRPAYQRMLQDLRSGRIDAVVAWAPDRLHRSTEEHIAFLRLAVDLGFACQTINGGQMDTVTAGGMLTGKVLASIAEFESDLKSQRGKAKMDELRRNGKFTGGRRAFGLTEGRRALVPEEAARVRQAAKDILGGRRMYSVVQEWNTSGVTTAAGNRWRVESLRDLLISQWARGRSTDGSPAEWPALLDEATSLRLDVLLNDPARRRTRPETRRYLLTGFLRCGLCGSRMSHGTNNGAYSYRCWNCHRLHVIAKDAELDVTNRVVARVNRIRLGELVVQTPSRSGAELELEDLEARGGELADMLADGELDRAAYARARDRLNGRIEEVKGRLREDLEADRRAETMRTAFDLVEHWDALDLDAKRAFIAVFAEHAMVKPAVRGRNSYDPGRLQVSWF